MRLRGIVHATGPANISHATVGSLLNSEFKAIDTRGIFVWRRQCNGGKIVALPSRERNCLCIIICDGNAKLRAIIAEISNNLLFGNDCRKLGGVVKEGQG